MSNPQTNIVTDLLNRWHLPHFSAQTVSAYEMDRNPYTIYLGPSKELLMEASIALVKRLSRNTSGSKQGGMETPPHFKTYSKGGQSSKRVGLVTHHTGVLDTAWTLTMLQHLGHETVVELLQSTDVRPHLARMRSHQVDIIIVDMADTLIKPFLYQVLWKHLFSPFGNHLKIPLIVLFSKEGSKVDYYPNNQFNARLCRQLYSSLKQP